MSMCQFKGSTDRLILRLTANSHPSNMARDRLLLKKCLHPCGTARRSSFDQKYCLCWICTSVPNSLWNESYIYLTLFIIIFAWFYIIQHILVPLSVEDVCTLSTANYIGSLQSESGIKDRIQKPHPQPDGRFVAVRGEHNHGCNLFTEFCDIHQ